MAEFLQFHPGDHLVVSVAEAIRRGGLPIRVLREQSDIRTLRAGKALLGMLGRCSGAASLMRASRHVPEAVVKFVPRGGVNTPVELRAQLTYIGRLGEDREVPLRSSLGFDDAAMTRDEVDDLIRDWSESWRGMSDYGQTRHMIVSFPEEFDPERAEDAAREAVFRAFGSGAYGDVWEYVSAFHAGDDETPNPHLHVVVQSRGMENGLWMDTRMHAALSPDTLRQLVAEEARDVGLELNATARFERGHLTRGVSSADHWREQSCARTVGRAENRRPVSDAKRIARNYAGIAYQSLGSLITETNTLMHNALNSAAERIKSGESVGGGPVIAQTPETTARLDRILESGGVAVENIDRGLSELNQIRDPGARQAKERQLRDMRADASYLLPDRPDYLAYDMAPMENIYAVPPDEDAAREAKRIGLDPDELALRAGETPSLGQVADWQARDVGLILERQGYGEGDAPDRMLDRVRGALRDIYAGLTARSRQSQVELDAKTHAMDDDTQDRSRQISRGIDDDDGHSL